MITEIDWKCATVKGSRNIITGFSTWPQNLKTGEIQRGKIEEDHKIKQ